MSMFSKMGDMYRLQKQARKIKKELGALHVVNEHNGVKVTVSGENELVSIEFTEDAPQDLKKLSKLIVSVGNKALKKAQTMAAEKMKDVMGGLQGLMGGK